MQQCSIALDTIVAHVTYLLTSLIGLYLTSYHYDSADKVAEHLLLLCENGMQLYFSESVDVTDVFEDYVNVLSLSMSVAIKYLYSANLVEGRI